MWALVIADHDDYHRERKRQDLPCRDLAHHELESVNINTVIYDSIGSGC